MSSNPLNKYVLVPAAWRVSTKFANAFVEAYQKVNKGFVGTPAASALISASRPEPQAVAVTVPAPVEQPIAPKQVGSRCSTGDIHHNNQLYAGRSGYYYRREIRW